MPRTLIHTFKFLLGFEAPESQTSHDEREAIKKYAKNKKVAAEIGVFEGLTTEIIANSVDKDGIVYAIDPFFKGRLGLCYGEIISKKYWKRKQCINKIKVIKNYSYNAAKFINEKFDFIFIDGDHSYDGIKQDWEDWSVKLNKGGFILLHDTCLSNHNPNVSTLGSYRFFNEVILKDKRFKVIEQVDSMSILEKII